MRAYPNVNWRYLISQKDSASGLKELTFDKEVTWPLQLNGREQATEAIAYGPGFGFDQLPTTI